MFLTRRVCSTRVRTAIRGTDAPEEASADRFPGVIKDDFLKLRTCMEKLELASFCRCFEPKKLDLDKSKSDFGLHMPITSQLCTTIVFYVFLLVVSANTAQLSSMVGLRTEQHVTDTVRCPMLAEGTASKLDHRLPAV